MKTLFTTAALVAGLMAVTTDAYARNCAAEAQAAVEAQTRPAGAALLGCGIGAGLGQILSNGQAGAIVGGCAAGGATGLVISAEKRQKIYNAAYASCMGQSGPAPQPVAFATVPPPTGNASTPYNKTINMRTGPGTNYAVAEKLPANTSLSVALCSNTGWCQVGGYTGPGWVSQSLLTFY